MNRAIFTLILFFGFFSLISCGSGGSDHVDFSGDPISVVVSKTSSAAVEVPVIFSGKLVAKNSVNVSSRMMGYITRLNVEVGQHVNAGQLLVSLNAADIQAKNGQANAGIANAQAAYQNAKKDYERFQNLYNSQSASQKELDDIRTRFEMASAGLQGAKQMKNEVNAQFSYSNITAPISGTVTSKFSNEGDLASPGMPILTIESPSVLQAEVGVSENSITHLKQGMPATLLMKSSGEEMEGEVVEISKSSSQTGGQYLVKISVPQSPDLLPGMFVHARFPIGSRPQASEEYSDILIPQSALVRKGQLNGIYVVSAQKTAILRWLRLGKEYGDKVEVLSGLQPDESYILSAEGKLFNGAKLNLK